MVAMARLTADVDECIFVLQVTPAIDGAPVTSLFIGDVISHFPCLLSDEPLATLCRFLPHS